MDGTKLYQGACLSGPILKNKASGLVCVQGTEFTPTDGWLSHWKVRHDIVYKNEQEEKQDADLPTASDWKHEVLPEILQLLNLEDIFNADETGLAL